MSYKISYPRNVSKVFLTDIKSFKCILSCDEMHPLYKCSLYKNMSVSDRVELVKLKHLYFNCLSKYKLVACRNNFSCSVCKKKYLLTLHFPHKEKIYKVILSQIISHENKNIQLTLVTLSSVFQPLQANMDKNLFSTMYNFANDYRAVLLVPFVCLVSNKLGKL